MIKQAVGAALGFVAVATLAQPARAEMYEWIDAKGVTHLTSYLPPDVPQPSPSPAPLIRQQTVSVLRTQAPAPAPSPAPLASARPQSAATAAPRHVVEFARVQPPAPAAALAQPPVTAVKALPTPARPKTTAPVVAGQPEPRKATPPVVVAQPAPRPPVSAPTPVTAQISRSTRTIQVINGNRLSEQQQVTTTSVSLPH